MSEIIVMGHKTQIERNDAEITEPPHDSTNKLTSAPSEDFTFKKNEISKQTTPV